MKKWIDDIEKQIDAIEAGEVDAKNLSEVLDKDAPIKLTTDLQNNKVKVGLDIDNETLEVNNGKLKVKAGGSGAKKYLHKMAFDAWDRNDSTIMVRGYFEFMTEDATPYSNQYNGRATTKDFVNNTLVPALFGKPFADIPNQTKCAISGHLYQFHNGATKALEPYDLKIYKSSSESGLVIDADGIYIDNGVLTTTSAVINFASYSNDININIMDDLVIEL